jgi:hypothetical protein
MIKSWLAPVQLTFAEFQATRRWCADLGKAIADARWDGEPPAKGNLYLDALYIEEVQAHWPEAAKAQGKWHLLSERSEYIDLHFHPPLVAHARN